MAAGSHKVGRGMTMNGSRESNESAVAIAGADQAAPLRKPWERPAVRALDVRETQFDPTFGDDGAIAGTFS